jgi:hypothetical protein
VPEKEAAILKLRTALTDPRINHEDIAVCLYECFVGYDLDDIIETIDDIKEPESDEDN